MILARRRSSCALRPLFAAEHLHRRPVVDVFVAAERVDQRLLVRKMREHAQLDLRVVGRDQHVAAARRRRRARISRPTSVRIGMFCRFGIAAAQTSGGGDRLVEAGVHAAGFRVDQLRQRVDVGALQLHQRRATRGPAAAARARAPAPRALRTPSTAPWSSSSAGSSRSSCRACRRGSPTASSAS